MVELNSRDLDIPSPRGDFKLLSPRMFQVIALKAQGLTEAQTGARLGITKKAVATYTGESRIRLALKAATKDQPYDTAQDVFQAYYLEYAPGLYFPDLAADH